MSAEFQIIDEKRYPLKTRISTLNADYSKKDHLPYWRFEHRVTLGYNAREFILIVDNLRQKIYLEEVIGGHLEVIDDDSLWESLYKYATEQGYCNMMMPLLKNIEERFF
jgi:hypothetical protein